MCECDECTGLGCQQVAGGEGYEQDVHGWCDGIPVENYNCEYVSDSAEYSDYNKNDTPQYVALSAVDNFFEFFDIFIDQS